MTTFTNPQNNHQENTSNAWLWALLFGPLYFAYKRCFGHALISLALAAISFGISFIVYAFFARKIISNNYLSMGWVDTHHLSTVNHPETPPPAEPSNLLGHATFQYTDTNGDETTRNVIVQNIYSYAGKRYIKTHCNDNDDQRTFRIDRINGSITMLSTGEIISPGTLIDEADENVTQQIATTGHKRITPSALPKHLTPPSLISGQLFKITDETDYKEALLYDLTQQEASQLTQEDILNLDPSELELEISDLFDILTEEQLKKIKLTPAGAADLLQEQYIANKAPNNPQPLDKIIASSKQTQQLVKHGYLTIIPRTQAIERAIIEMLTVVELQPVATALGIKISQKKAQLVSQIIPAIEPTTPLPNITIPNTTKLTSVLKQLTQQYNEEAQICMQNAPINYAKAIQTELDRAD